MTSVVMVPSVVVLVVVAGAPGPIFMVCLSLQSKQLSLEFLRRLSQVNKVAKSSSGTLSQVKLPALRLSKFGDWRVLCLDGTTLVKSAVNRHECALCTRLVNVLDVDVSYHVGVQVIAGHDVLNFAVLGQLGEYVLVEFVKVLLHRGWIDLRHLLRRKTLVGVVVHVLQKNGLG